MRSYATFQSSTPFSPRMQATHSCSLRGSPGARILVKILSSEAQAQHTAIDVFHFGEERIEVVQRVAQIPLVAHAEVQEADRALHRRILALQLLLALGL